MPTSLPTTENDPLRAQLLESLRGGSAHADVKTVTGGIPEADRGVRPKGLPHSAWELVEHMRTTLEDLHRFSTDPEYAAPEWPKDYWPATEVPPNAEAWRKSVEGLQGELGRMAALVEDPGVDLEAAIPWGQGQTILREVLLAVAHTSYHLGQLVLVRRLLGDWKH